MSELLTSLDVVNQGFKKSMRGYDPVEVDEFLDRVAESIQSYVQKIKDCERVMADQSERLRDYDNVKNTLQDTLVTAQKTAKEKVESAALLAEDTVSQASSRAADIVSEARAKAEKIIKDAEARLSEFGNEIESLQSLRESGFTNIRDIIRSISEVIDKAESGGKLRVPDLTTNVLGRAARSSAPSAQREAPERVKPEISEEAKKQELSNTLNILGIDPSLLNSDMRIER